MLSSDGPPAPCAALLPPSSMHPVSSHHPLCPRFFFFLPPFHPLGSVLAFALIDLSLVLFSVRGLVRSAWWVLLSEVLLG